MEEPRGSRLQTALQTELMRSAFMRETAARLLRRVGRRRSRRGDNNDKVNTKVGKVACGQPVRRAAVDAASRRVGRVVFPVPTQ